MNSAARRYLLLFTLFSVASLTVCVLTLSEISLAYPMLMGAMAFWSIHHNTSAKRRYVLPMLWSLFFVLGYVLSFASVLIDPETSGIGPRKDTSLFDFTDTSFSTVFWVMLSGMAGVTLAGTFFEKIYGRSRGFLTAANPSTASFCRDAKQTPDNVRPFATRNLTRFSWFWMLSSVSIIVVMWALGIGRTGLSNATVLPFMLAGILVYMKNMVIPFLGFVLFVAAERTHDYRQIRMKFLMLLIVGVVGAIAFVSRGFFVFMIVPALIYLGLYGRNRSLSRRLVREGGLLVIGLMLILMPGIELLRLALYSGLSVTALTTTEVSEGTSLLGAFGKIAALATGRIVGFRELVFITNLQEYDVWAPWRVFAGDDSYTSMLSYRLYNFEQDASGETAFGYALGLWGMFYLSGSYVLVFLGSVIAASVVLAFEEIFLRRGYAQLSLYMAINIGLWVWGGIDWFLLSRLLVSALFCYGLVRYTRLSAFLR